MRPAQLRRIGLVIVAGVIVHLLLVTQPWHQAHHGAAPDTASGSAHRKALRRCVASWNAAFGYLFIRVRYYVKPTGSLPGNTCLISFMTDGNQRSAYQAGDSPWTLLDKEFPRAYSGPTNGAMRVEDNLLVLLRRAG